MGWQKKKETEGICIYCLLSDQFELGEEQKKKKKKTSYKLKSKRNKQKDTEMGTAERPGGRYAQPCNQRYGTGDGAALSAPIAPSH